MAKKLTQTKAKNDQGVLTAERDWLLGAYLEYWLEDVVKVNRRPATYTQCETIVRLYLRPDLGGYSLNKLSVPLVQSYMKQLQKDGRSVSLVHVIRKVLSAALSRAEREELVNRNVARLVDLPAEERKEIRPWSVTEVMQFLEVVRGHRLYAAFLMLFYGLRKGELLGLRWQDIDAENSKVHIRQQLQRVGREILIGPLKTRKSRRDLPLLAPIVEALAQYYEKYRVDGADLVFTTTEGNPIDPGNFLRDFKRICQQNGLRVITVHSVRHTVATLLKSQKVADRDIQLILGHSRIITTQEIYQHDDDDSRRNALQGLTGALLEPNSTKTVQGVSSGPLMNVVDSNGSCQNGCQKQGIVMRLVEIISGGAYRIRTDDLFHAMKKRATVAARVTEVDTYLKARRRQLLLGIVAVNLDVKAYRSHPAAGTALRTQSFSQASVQLKP
ncbi:tyrosine-type recombinase/integrase [Streptomyces sp. 029-5]|uniref:tyrosine-type recombinase/integrase n=1 Tax=Streptomyces sp. 029-5 TaxID=2789261 RepID=UPI0039815570